MAETIDRMEIELAANVAPMLAQVKAGLERVRESVQTIKGFARVDLTASLDQLMGTLRDAQGKVTEWKGQAERAATVAPKVDPAPALTGLGAIRAKFDDLTTAVTGMFFWVQAYQQVAGAIQSVIAASDAQELAFTRLNQAVANNATATSGMFDRLKAQAEDLAATFGFLGDEQIASAQAVLVGFGLTEEAVVKLTPSLVDMAAGLEKASGKEQDLEGLAKLVGKAMQGQGEALGRMGIQIDEARAKTDPLGAALAGLARFNGQAAAASETHAGRARALANSFDELKESLGDMLKAVLTPMGAALKALLDAFLWLPQPVQTAVVALVALSITLKALHTDLITAVARLLLFIDTTAVGAVAAVKQLAVALATLNFSGFATGVLGGVGALKTLIANMSVAGVVALEFAAAIAAAYLVGKGIAWVADQFGNITKAEREFGAAALEAQNAHLKQKYGLDLTTDALRVWNQLSAEARNRLAEQAAATGRTTYAVSELTAELNRLQAAQQAASNAAFWDATAKFYEDRVRFFSQSRRSQLVEEINLASQARDAAAKGSEERKKAEEDLKRLTSQLAQEDVRAAEEGARKHTEAAKRAKDAWTSMVEAANEAFRKFRAQASEAADQVAQEMAMAALKAANPEGAAVVAAQMLAQKRIADAQYIEDAQKRAEVLKQIEEQLGRDIAEIHLKYATEEAQKETDRQAKAKADLDKAAQDARTKMQEIVAGITNPVDGMIQKLLTTLGPAAAAFGQIMANALQPVSQALTSFLTGAKVKWSTVLQQMAGQFVSMLVNKVIAGIIKMVTTWLFGEKAKAAATATGTAAAVGANAVQSASNTATAGTGILAAIANIFKAHSSIPFVGVAIAIGFVALMMALFSSMKSKTKAMATGGLVDSPQLALIGERGPEFVAPAQDFKDVVASLVAGTLDTVRVAAREVVPRGWTPAMAGGPGGAAMPPSMASEMHLHGFALVDTGEREMLGRTNRLLQRAQREAKALTASDADHVGA